MPKRFSLAALFVLLTASSALAAAPFPAQVIHIADGDTITVLRDQQQIKIRLFGIDCPESRQPWGRKAKMFTAALVGKFLVERITRTPVEVDLASEFRHRDPLVRPQDLVVLVSQSGETLDTIGTMRKAKAKGAKVLSICNVVGSTLARE